MFEVIKGLLGGSIMDIKQICVNASDAAIKMAALDTEAKNNALAKIAEALQSNKDKIIAANNIDLKSPAVICQVPNWK